jgi:hypothetical protein
LFNYNAPFFHQYGTAWLYYFPTPSQVTLHCTDDQAVPQSVSLHGAGLIHNSTSCHISSNEVLLLPELRGTTQTQLKDVTPVEIQELNDIHSRVKASQPTFDVDSLLHVHQTQLQQERKTHWLMVIIASFIATMILFICSYVVYTRWYATYKLTKLEVKPNSPSCPESQPEQQQQELQSREQMHGQRVTFAPCRMPRTD